MKKFTTNNAIVVVASAAFLLVSVLGAQESATDRSKTATPGLSAKEGQSGWRPGGSGQTSEWGAGKGSFGLKPQTSGVWRDDTLKNQGLQGSRELHSQARLNTARVSPAFRSHPSVAAGGVHAAVHGGPTSSFALRRPVLKSSTGSAGALTKPHEKRETLGQKPGFGAEPTKPSTSLGPKTQAPRKGTLDTGSSIKRSTTLPE